MLNCKITFSSTVFLLTCRLRETFSDVSLSRGNRGTGLKEVISWSLFITVGWSRLSDRKETVTSWSWESCRPFSVSSPFDQKQYRAYAAYKHLSELWNRCLFYAMKKTDEGDKETLRSSVAHHALQNPTRREEMMALKSTFLWVVSRPWKKWFIKPAVIDSRCDFIIILSSLSWL